MASKPEGLSLYQPRSVLPFDVIYHILELFVKSTPSTHEFMSILYVCKEFRHIMDKLAYKSITLNKPDSFFHYCDSSKAVMKKNRTIHESLLLLLKNRQELASRVEYLSIHSRPAHVDCHISDVQFQIIRQCTSLNNLRLCLQQKYKTGKRTEKLSTIIRKVNPTFINLYTYLWQTKPGSSQWDLLDMLSFLQGCSKLRHLVVHPEIYRRLRPQDIPDDLELPLETLVIEVNGNMHWTRGLIFSNTICLTKLKLPNLKIFKATMLADDPEDKDAFRRCLTENWVETLTELYLTAAIIDIDRFDARYDIFGVPNARVPRLKKMRISARVLRPQTLLMMSPLEEVCYCNASTDDLDVLASTLESRDDVLPALKSFFLDELMPWAGPEIIQHMVNRI